jgi:hypothetical protein
VRASCSPRSSGSRYHCPEYAEESDDGEEDDLKRGFDVQSIVSTYSNLENHPGKIAVPKRTPKKKQPQPQPQPPPPPQHDPLALRAGAPHTHIHTYIRVRVETMGPGNLKS